MLPPTPFWVEELINRLHFPEGERASRRLTSGDTNGDTNSAHLEPWLWPGEGLGVCLRDVTASSPLYR